jgi:pyruvate-ferredoxin/flavodoxin oxidoreductase
MTSPSFATIDGNEAVARVAYRLSEVIAIYPITPATPMGEWSDAWSATARPNLWGQVPSVLEMQSEAGAAGALHGALQAGALATSFTASQGLLLMIPNLYKIAGELSPFVLHVAARSLAAQGLSIFGDHSDVMACRGTGSALLAAASPQEAQDFAAIAQRSTLDSRIPFLHFFDGFRTSHEIQKVQLIDDETLRAFIPQDEILAHRQRALTPDRPVLRGTAQNPDVYFQARESVNRFYDATPQIVQQAMDDFAQLTGRQYHLFEYCGHPEAERVVVLMGSGCEAAQEAVENLLSQGEKVGLVKVRLYRPFVDAAFRSVLPASVRAIAVLDRCKEPGASAEPLYLDVVNALAQADRPLPKIVGGRYGLSSKEFTPAMVKAVLDNLSQAQPQHPFTVGITDDLTHLSLAVDADFSTEASDVVRAVFYGLGSDGTVGANKNSIKIIGEETDNYAQGYFVYDSKKSGSVTVSHLRFGPQPIRSTYLITQANFIACHQWSFCRQFDVLETAMPGSIFLLNSPYPAPDTWVQLPRQIQQRIVELQLQPYVIDAFAVAEQNGMGRYINTVMQVCFFALSGVLPREEAIARIKDAIRKTYGKKGEAVVQANLKAVDATLENLHALPVGEVGTEMTPIGPQIPDTAPAFVRQTLAPIMARQGDAVPVSALPCDGTFPTGTTKYEKRDIAEEIPVWDPEVCVQCGKCVMVCPHAVIRAKVYEPGQLTAAPTEFKHTTARDKAWDGLDFTIQVSPQDCTGCSLCVEVCPAKNKLEPRKKAINMAELLPLRESEKSNWNFFLDLPNPDRLTLNLNKIAQQQMQEPLFEFSGACGGCGETPYIKLATQLFGDRMLIANATGCSSIYGGNLPTTPYSQNAEGRGPAWSNSLFEDNAEFGLGMRLGVDQHRETAAHLLHQWAASESPLIPGDLAQAILAADQSDEAGIYEQRQRVAGLKRHLQQLLETRKGTEEGRSLEQLLSLADYLVKKSVWIIGGDGWAYDIGFGGLDHVIASGRNVNLLVLDTEVYSNTGGQKSKATPIGAVAKFAAGGKRSAKKDLGLIAMTYGTVYVASIAMGARDEQTIRAFLEAESYDGPSLIIAYSHCIAHGIDMSKGMDQQRKAVESGRWLLYRYDPRREAQGLNPLQLDSRNPKLPLAQDLYSENRFNMLRLTNPAEAQVLLEDAQDYVRQRWAMYQYLANQPGATPASPPPVTPPSQNGQGKDTTQSSAAQGA